MCFLSCVQPSSIFILLKTTCCINEQIGDNLKKKPFSCICHVGQVASADVWKVTVQEVVTAVTAMETEIAGGTWLLYCVEYVLHCYHSPTQHLYVHTCIHYK